MWWFSWEFWLAATLVLLIVDAVLGLSFYLVPFAAGSAVLAGLYMLGLESIDLQDWKTVATVYAGVTLVLAVVLRKLFRQQADKSTDINDY